MDTITLTKLEDLKTVFGSHWRSVWEAIKAETKTRQRKPRLVFLNQGRTASPTALNDYSLGLRMAFDVATGHCYKTVRVHAGEWACVAPNPIGQVQEIPDGMMVIDVEWNDSMREFTLSITSPNIQGRLCG